MRATAEAVVGEDTKCTKKLCAQPVEPPRSLRLLS